MKFYKSFIQLVIINVFSYCNHCFFLILYNRLLGNMLPQYMALSVLFVCVCVCPKKFVCPFVGLHCGCVPPPVKICVSVRWVTLWVRTPL